MNFGKNIQSQQDYILCIDVDNHSKLQAKEDPAT